MRGDLLELMAGCVDHAECGSPNQLGAHIAACLTDVRRNAVATEKAKDACARLDALGAKCQAAPLQGCLERLKVVNDAFAARVSGCADQPCQEAKACLNELSTVLTE